MTNHIKDLIQQEGITSELTDFYFEHGIFGFFFFKKDSISRAYADKKAQQFLSLDTELASFDPLLLLDQASGQQLSKLSQTSSKEITEHESFILKWIVGDKGYKTVCKAHYVDSKGVIAVGITDTLAELAEAEEEIDLYKEYVQSSTDAIQVSDSTGRLVYINAVAEQRLGIQKEEVEKFHVMDFEKSFKTIEDWNLHFEKLKTVESLRVESTNMNISTGESIPVEVTTKYARVKDQEYVIASARDITEKKRADESESKFKSLVSGINEGFVLQSEDGSIIASNAKAESILGLSKDQLSGRTSLDPRWKSIHQDGRDFPGETHPAMATLNDGQSRQNVIMGVHKPDDSLTWISINTEPLFKNGASSPYAVFASFTDITDKRDTEKALQLEKTRLDNIIKAANLGTWEWNLIENTLNYNANWAKMIGYELHEVSPGTKELWSSKVHPDDLALAEKAIEAHFQNRTEVYEAEFRMKHKLGHWVTIESTGKIITRDEEGNPILFTGTHLDISERKNAETELEKSERQYRFLVEGSNDIIFSLDVNGYLNFISPAWERLLGYSLEESIGQHFSEVVGSGDLNRLEDLFKQSIEKGEYVKDAQYRTRHKNGEWKWHAVNGSAIYNGKGEIIGFNGLARDITQQKLNELNLSKQSKIRSFLVEIGSDFINIPLNEVSDAINTALAKVGEFFGVDRTYIIEYNWRKQIAKNTYEWCAEGIISEKDNLQEMPIEMVQHWADQHKKGEKWDIADTSKLDDNDEFKHILLAQKIKSLVTFPLISASNCFGCVGFDSVKQTTTYSKAEEDLLLLFSKMLVNVFDRIKADKKLLDSETKLLKAKVISEESKKRLLLATEAAYLGVWEWEPENNNVIWDERSFAIFGKEKDKDIPTYDLWYESLHKDDRDSIAKALEHSLAYHEELNEVYRIMHPNGEVRYVHSFCHFIRNEEGKSVRVIGLHKDVTEEKKAEDLLKQSKDVAERANIELKEAQKVAKLGSWYLDVKTNNVTWSDELYRIYGYELGAPVPEYPEFEKIFKPDSWQRLTANIERAIQTGESYDLELEFFKNDDSPRWMWARGECVLNQEKEIIGLRGVSMDITEKKLLQMEMRAARDASKESEKRLKLAADSAQLGIWDWDIATDTTTWDEETYLIFGKSHEKNKELNFEFWSSLIHPDDREREVDLLKNALAEKDQFSTVYRIIHDNGQIAYISASGVIIREENQEPLRIIGVVKDVTRDRERENELTRSRELAESASLAKSEFLANMSHEIRTPLNSVIGFTELLLQTELTDLQKDYMASVNYSADSLMTLINDILDFSKIEAGKLELETERVDVHELLYQIIEMVRFKLVDKDIELLLHIAADVPQFIFADAIRIRQILVNLMSNAIKFTETGEIELSLAAIERKTKDQRISLHFEVRDTGIGISKDKQQHIFEAFSQEDTSTTRSYGGTGLGLSISSQLLSLMGSTLQLHSQQGKGSSFFFEIELEYDSAHRSHVQTTEGISSILVLDDHEKSLENIQNQLLKIGIKSEGISNGIEALSLLQANPEKYDALLVDYQMPFMDGKQVVEQIRTKLNLNQAQLPILMMHSNLLDEKLNNLSDALAISALLPKPLSREELSKGFAQIGFNSGKGQLLSHGNPKAQRKAHFKGNAILVVDDNELNRKVAKSMITRLYDNVILDEAESGEAGFEKARNKHFDLILMDIQMPGISGYEATEKIRSFQKDNQKSVIIALTAATAKEDKDRCLAAGMDDYMSKPASLQKFKSMMNKWFDANDWDDADDTSAALVGSEQTFNYQAFLNKLNNDHEAVEDILDSVRLGTLKERIEALTHQFNRQNAEGIKKEAHKIKGICLSLYFEKLAQLVLELEKSHPKYSDKNARSTFAKIISEYDTVEKVINEKSYLPQ